MEREGLAIRGDPVIIVGQVNGSFAGFCADGIHQHVCVFQDNVLLLGESFR
jgi:hypothetical protein